MTTSLTWFKIIIAVEPLDHRTSRASGHRNLNNEVHPSGLYITSLTYDPPASPTSPIKWEQRQPSSVFSEHAACWSQKGTSRQLVHLAKTPVLVVTGEASYHALFDHRTVRYHTDTGLNTEQLRLADHGVHGNGHMMMLEKNNLEIA